MLGAAVQEGYYPTVDGVLRVPHTWRFVGSYKQVDKQDNYTYNLYSGIHNSVYSYP